MKYKFILLIFLFIIINLYATSIVDILEREIQYKSGITNGEWRELEVDEIKEFSVLDSLVLKIQMPEGFKKDDIVFIESSLSNLELISQNLNHYILDSQLISNKDFLLLSINSADDLLLTINFHHKYLYFPIDNIVVIKKEAIQEFLNNYQRNKISQYGLSFLSYFLFLFSVCCVFLSFYIKSARSLLIAFSIFSFVEGLLQIPDASMVLSIFEFPVEVYIRYEISLDIIHYIALLIITKSLIAKKKNIFLSLLIYIQIFIVIFVNIWLFHFSLNDIPNLLYLTNYLLISGTIIYCLVKYRKSIYPKSGIYLGFIYSLLPIISTMIEHLIYEEILFFVYLILTFIILLLFIYGIIQKYQYYQKKVKEKTEILEQKEMEMSNMEKEKLLSQLNFLKNQLNPHFLFNALSSLTTLIDEDKEKGIEYVEQLSLMFRYVLLSGRKELIRLTEELRFIKSYVYLLNIRYNGNLHIQADFDEETLETFIPPLTFQLLLENAVKHNIIDDKNPMILSIKTFNNFILVENNLSDFQDDFNKSESTNIGHQNLNVLYDYYTKKKIEIENGNNFYRVKLPIISLSD